ncbi:transmembrane protein [Trifolium medium]|uniref:Transmembrane protein n=1 Tax=Trifolium medium TaxID=97028 RepID=A0A392TRF9_9FABA|nr:transmembrane protein [Trifolium medium]
MASSSATTLMKFFSFFLVVVFAAVVALAQDLSPSLAPAPGHNAGAAGSVTNSMAMIGASIVLSMIAIFKH